MNRPGKPSRAPVACSTPLCRGAVFANGKCFACLFPLEKKSK